MANKAAAVLLTVALLFCAAPPARAGFVSTEDLTRSCMSSKKEQVGMCLNFIAGVIDYHILLQSMGSQPIIDFCLPNNITIEDAGVAVMTYLKKHPEHDALAAAVVPLALNDAWACHPIKKAPITHSRRHKH
jgi:hypothetical protein